jgi:eukaryotic-like serine/threonine-protein kinase
VSQAPARAAARVLAQRYELHERIGAGGAGAVWRAHDRVLDRIVAVKLLRTDVAEDPEAAARFRAEASAAAKLTHPNAVVVYDIGRDGDDDYIVMEHVAGATLSDLLREGPLPPAIVAAVGMQVGRALGTAHGRGLVHRDVKPANVLVTNEGVVKVADFGIARALGDGSSRLTTTGAVMGTARYLAPEQLRDEPVDARADVYALGLLLHQCCTGDLPFGDGSAVEVAMRRLTTALPDVRQQGIDVPPELAEVITRATAADREGRFEDGAALAGALQPAVPADAASRLAGLVRTAAGTRAGASVTDRGATRARSEHTAPTGAAAPPRATPAQATVGETTAAPAGAGRSPSQPDTSATAQLTVDPPTYRTRRRWPLAMLVVVLLLAGLAAATQLGSEQAPEDADAPPDDVEATEEPDTGSGPIVIADAGDHDPFGSGDEHPDRVGDAFDGDPTTYWRTQGYRGSPELGGLKPGVGIWLQLEGDAPVAELTIATTNPGADLTVYAADAPPGPDAAPDEWGSPVAEISDAAADETLVFDDPVDARVWLLWFTSLPPDEGVFRATVSEVTFAAP